MNLDAPDAVHLVDIDQFQLRNLAQAGTRVPAEWEKPVSRIGARVVADVSTLKPFHGLTVSFPPSTATFSRACKGEV